jgi:hypothetical protein
MAASKPTKNELLFAKGLIKALKGNVNNVYLLLAVVAWIRKEGTGFKYWNPLNIRNSKYAIGKWGTSNGGGFAIFKDMATAIKATAAFLKANLWAGYDAIIGAAMQFPDHKDYQAEQMQAVNFLNAIALSKWSSDHYGTTKHPETLTAAELYAKNGLIKIWAGLLGIKFSMPADPVKPKPKPKKKPPPAPRPTFTPLQKRDYLDGYAAKAFLDARVKSPPLAPGGMYDVIK